jgi:hypothetical protein
MNENEAKEMLYDYAKNRLTPEQAKAVESALASSESLAKELARIRAYYAALDGMEPVRASNDFLDKVHKRIESRTGARGLAGLLFFPLRVKLPLELLGVGVAALVVLLVFVPRMHRASDADRFQYALSETPSAASGTLLPEQQASPAPPSLASTRKAGLPSRADKYPRKMEYATKAKRASQPRQGSFDGVASATAVAEAEAEKPAGAVGAPAVASGKSGRLAFADESRMEKKAGESAKIARETEEPSRVNVDAAEAPSRRISAEYVYAFAQNAPASPAEAGKDASESVRMRAGKKMKAESAPLSAAQEAAPPAAGTAEGPARDEFLKSLAAKFHGTIQIADSASYRMYTIRVQSAFLASLFDELRTHGDLRLSQGNPPLPSSGTATVLLGTVRR